MAKITLDLNRFKASGIYTIEFDASERVVVSTQTIRLVVGFSRVGPFNAPTFLRDIRQSRKIFGTIDSVLEARGSFFHRALETCLGTGPVFALNLLALNNVPVNEGGDAVDYRSFALAADENNGNITRALYASFYNKERFWFPDVDYLQATVDSKPANRGRLFNVVNLGQQVTSVIIRKSVNATQYNITAEDYYDADEIPDYVYAKDYMSDYFVDVYVVKGDWTNHSLLAQDPTYSKYFDLRGLRADKLDAFLSMDGITMLGAFTGCIIPNFLDNNGSNQSIDVIVNANVAVSGLFLNINEDALSDYVNSTYKVDMIGNTLINTTDDVLDFLSYNSPIKSILTTTGNDGDFSNELITKTFNPSSGSVAPYVKSYPYGGKFGKFGNVLVVPKPIPSDTTFTVAQWEAFYESLTTNSLIRLTGTDTILDSAYPNDYAKVDNVVNTGTELLIKLSTPLHLDDNYQSINGVAEDKYIAETVAALIPTAANVIDVVNLDEVGIATISATAQTTPKGQVIATISAPVTNTIAGATPGTYTAVASTSAGNGTGATFNVVVAAGGTVSSVTLNAAGTKYQLTDVITIDTTTFIGTGTGALTISPASLVPISYTATSTSTGSGTGATFTVAYSSTGGRTVTVLAAGKGYQVSDPIIIPQAQVGGVPAANVTFTVASLEVGPSINAGDIILIEAPGYAKYFEVASSPVIGSTTPITVKSTSLTVGAPFFQSKTCVAGFASDEFSAYLQPSDIKVTLLDTTAAVAEYLFPDLSVGAVPSTFGYILSPQSELNSIEGLGQTITAGAENLVTLYNETAAAAIAGSWYIVKNGATAAVGFESGTAPFGKVMIRNAAGDNTNPFDTCAATTDVVRVTLPGGGVFRGNPASIAATITVGDYTLLSTDILKFAYIESYPDSKLAKNIKGSLIVDGDRVKYASGASNYGYLNVEGNWGTFVTPYSRVAYGLNGTYLRQFTDTTLLTRANSTFAALDCTYEGSNIVTNANAGKVDYVIYSSLAKNIQENVAIEGTLFGGGKKFNLSAANASKIEVGDFIVNANLNDPKLTRVITKVKKLDPALGTPYYEYTLLEVPGLLSDSGIDYVTRFTPIQKFVDRFQFTAFSGFKMTEFHLPGTPAQLEKILSVLELTNVGDTLTSRDVIQFRYIVDTFNGGLEPHMGPKQYLSRLAKNRQQCMAILNSPSMAEFQASTDPRFTEVPDANAGNPKPVLNTEYIATGGNLSLGPSYTWGLPDEDNGAKFIGVFSPNIIIREDGKNKSIPPAADVSNNFVRKFINGEPYGIVAGPRRGVISNPKFVGMEYDFLLKDREHLEPIGINPIVVVRNVGPMIYANQSAYQRTLSAFNNLHVRDLLITIEEAVIEILQNYLFEFNDASTRLEIRTLVETYLDVVRTGGGIYAYSVIMDETNNTPELIDQNFGILDIGIEPARGLQKFISRITVLKTGAIASGGFAAV